MKKVLLILCLLSGSLASAMNTYNIAGSGLNGVNAVAGTPGTCTAASGYYSVPNAGACVHVSSGSSNINVTTSNSGNASAMIVYISDTQYGAHLVANGCSSWNNTGDYVAVVGFDMTGNCSNGLSMAGNFGKAIGNRIHDLPGTGGFAGLLAGNGKTGNQLIGNVIDNIGPYPSDSTFIHGIYVIGPGTIVENNIISRAAGWGIHIFHVTTQDVISNNVVINNNHGGILVSAADGGTNNNTSVMNNIVMNNGATGSQCGIEERFGPTGPSNVYRNNLLINNKGGNFCFPNGPETMSGNLCDVAQTGLCQTASASYTTTNTFVNYTGNAQTGDYHLKAGSAAIGAGVTGACASGGLNPCVPSTDFAGTAIASRQIGAYTFGGASAPGAPTGLTVVVH